MRQSTLPPGQQLVAAGKWPLVGERSPRFDDRPWQVQLAGAVARPSALSLAQLQSMPQIEQIVDIHCVTRWSKLAVRFGGVRLATLVELAQPTVEARFVSFVARSQRSHSTSLPLADALSLDTLIALSAEGQPLPQDHGGPLRAIVPGRYFYKSLKWLERIELIAQDRLGYWESAAGYHNTADPLAEQRYVAGGISRAEARAMLASRDLSGRQWLSLDARGHDLRRLDARQALLRNADFRGCDLREASFAGANLTNAHFEGADLRDVDFEQADLEGANFCGADLRGAGLANTRLLAATFCDTEAEAGGGRPLRLDKNTRFPAAALEDLTPEQQHYLKRLLADCGATPQDAATKTCGDSDTHG